MIIAFPSGVISRALQSKLGTLMRKSSWPVLACHTLTSWRLLVANKSDACLYYRDYNLYPLQVISLPWKADICDSIEVT